MPEVSAVLRIKVVGKSAVLMLSRLTKANRLRAAIVLALFYALCSVAPAAAFVFGDGSQVAHCLTGDDDHALHAAKPHEHTAANTHVHVDGTSHVHAKKSDAGKADDHGKTSDSKCCGLMCITALPASLANGNLPELPRMTAIAAVERYATGQPPVRLDKPPNSPLSL
jgi:hypothetical protein